MLYTLDVFVYNECVCFLALGASRRTASERMYDYGMLPGPWCPRISASDHMCCDMFMPSIHELLNSGMLAGVDTSPYL